MLQIPGRFPFLQNLLCAFSSQARKAATCHIFAEALTDVDSEDLRIVGFCRVGMIKGPAQFAGRIKVHRELLELVYSRIFACEGQSKSLGLANAFTERENELATTETPMILTESKIAE